MYFLHVLCTALCGAWRRRIGAFFGYLIQSIILEVVGVASVATNFGKNLYHSIPKEFVFLVKVVATLAKCN